jgi:5-methyltetrahydropteroyltriglutamate--homocysteine methyltransferase
LVHTKPITVPGYLYLRHKLGIPQAKVCIPSPTLLHFGAAKSPEISATAYPEGDTYGSAFFQDLAECYRKEIKALYDAGCRYIQVDETSLALMCDPKFKSNIESRGYKFDELLQQYVDLINASLDIPERGEITVSMHSCRGNYRAMWLAKGSYDSVAKALFSEIKVDSHFLEFDDVRSGGFEPLKYLAEGKTVVLGLITSKSAELERKEDVIERIRRAGEIVPLERLCLSAQCGFASTHHGMSCEILLMVGNPLTEEAQWAKVRLIVEVSILLMLLICRLLKRCGLMHDGSTGRF